MSILFKIVGFQSGQQQNQRSRAFSLTGQQTTIVGSLVGAQSCQTDWITIPCATNTGRVLQMGQTVCQDRICGDTFNSEASQVQMPVFSKLFSCSKLKTIAVCFLIIVFLLKLHLCIL